MKKCSWCGSETLALYGLKDGTFLCPVCAKKHYDTVEKKMKNHIKEVENGLVNRQKHLTKLTQSMCKHENMINTYYDRLFSKGITKEIWRCPDCGKTIYK